MGELFTVIFVFVAVGGIVGALFVVWVVLNIAQVIRRAIVGRPPQPRYDWLESSESACVVPNCRAVNPPAARFCRRCGHPAGTPIMPLPRQPMRPNMRRRQWQMMREI